MMDNPDNPWNFHQCKICTYKTRFLHYIIRHARQHMTRSKNHRFACNLHSPENHKCHKCPFRSDFKVLLKKHFDTVHRIKETQYYPTPLLKKCENCDFQTYSSLVLLSHDNRCVRSFLTKDKTSLKLEKGKKHSNLQRGRPPLHTLLEKDGFFQCSYCYKTIQKGYLKSHMFWKHTPSDQFGWFNCGKCSYRNKAKANLHAHMLSKKHFQHTEQKKTKRLECKQFRDNGSPNNIPTTSPSNTSLEYKKQLGRQYYPNEGKLKKNLCEASKDKNSVQLGKEKKHSNLRRGRPTRPPLHTPLKKDGFFQCSYCYKTIQKEYMKSHMFWKHTPSDQFGWFKCGNCSYRNKAKANLHAHMLSKKHFQHTEQKKTKRLECKQFRDNGGPNNIPTTSPSNTSLEYKKQLGRQHYPHEGKLKKNLCEASKDKNSVQLGKEKKHSNLRRGRPPLHTDRKEDGLFHCSYCSYKSTLKGSLKTHMLRTHTPIDQINWFECKQCFFKSKFKFRLCQHVIAKHSDPAELEKHKKFKCDQCPYKSLRKDHLGKHILARHTPSDQINWFKCEQCPYKSLRKDHLGKHIRVRHTSSDQINWFKCEHCSFKTKRKYDLNRHLNSRHLINPKINWFQCKQCFFKSKLKSKLAKHSDPAKLEKHKKFKCDQCPYKSLRKDHLGKHILYKHTPSDQINWFKCAHCSFKTKYKHLLIPHLNNRHLINPKNK